MSYVIKDCVFGLESLIGNRVLVKTTGYFYEGLLSAMNEKVIELKDPKIIYDTGPWADDGYEIEEKLQLKSSNNWFVNVDHIESFGLSKYDEQQ